MASQTEMAELKRTVEELGHKMDKQMIMVQGLVDLFTTIAPQSDMGLIKESSQACHTPAVGKCSKDMFKDLAEFHEARTHPKENAGSLFKANAEREDMGNKAINPKGKRVHRVEGAVLCNYKASKGSTLNPQSGRRNPPRTFSRFSTPLSSVYEKLLEAGFLKPLLPTPSPRTFLASYNSNAYCAFHQMPGHLTDACFRLRHAIQDLIDNGIIPAPLPSKPSVISEPLPQHVSNSHVSQMSTTSTQINPTSTIFNPSLHVVPENQPKPILSLPSEPEVNLMTIGEVEILTANTWVDSDEEPAKEKFKRKLDQSKEKTDMLWSCSHEDFGTVVQGVPLSGSD